MDILGSSLQNMPGLLEKFIKLTPPVVKKVAE